MIAVPPERRPTEPEPDAVAPGVSCADGLGAGPGAQAGQLDSVARKHLRPTGSPARPSHLPRRPLWLCRACAAEWPCLTARTLLVIEYVVDPVGLSVYLASMLQVAMADHRRLSREPGPDPARMYARFLGWAKPRLDIARNQLGTGAEGNRRRSRPDQIRAAWVSGGRPRPLPPGARRRP